MAVNTSNAPMGASMKPGFKLGLHDMAGGAKIRCLGFGHESGRPEHDKKSACRRQYKNSENYLLRPREHILDLLGFIT